MPRGITLTREVESKVFVPNFGGAFRMRMVASDNEMMPKTVFGLRNTLRDPHTSFYVVEFCFIASPEDFAAYPVDAPNETQSPPFYLSAIADCIYASRDLALAAWEASHMQVCELVEALNRKDELIVAEAVRCGAEDTETSESSTSVSV